MGFHNRSVNGVPVDERLVAVKLVRLRGRRWAARGFIYTVAGRVTQMPWTKGPGALMVGRDVGAGFSISWEYDGKVFTVTRLDETDRPELTLSTMWLIEIRAGQRCLFPVPPMGLRPPSMVSPEENARFVAGSARVQWAGPTAACLHNAYAVPTVTVFQTPGGDLVCRDGGHRHSVLMRTFDIGQRDVSPTAVFHDLDVVARSAVNPVSPKGSAGDERSQLGSISFNSQFDWTIEMATYFFETISEPIFMTGRTSNHDSYRRGSFFLRPITAFFGFSTALTALPWSLHAIFRPHRAACARVFGAWTVSTPTGRRHDDHHHPDGGGFVAGGVHRKARGDNFDFDQGNSAAALGTGRDPGRFARAVAHRAQADGNAGAHGPPTPAWGAAML